MKKLLIAISIVIGLVAIIQSEDLLDIIGRNEPVVQMSRTVPALATTYLPSMTISQPGANIKTCLTNMTITGNSNMTAVIIDGSVVSGTTVYAVTVSSGVAFQQTWSPIFPFCGGINSTMTITLANLTGNSTSQISVFGYKKKTQ